MKFNPNLFKKKTGYKPYVSNFTEIIQVDKKSNDLLLKFDDNSVYCVYSSDFMHFVFKNKVLITSNTFNFPIVLDSYGFIHTEESYNKWLAAVAEVNSIALSMETLTPGTVYTLDNGDAFLFIGKKYGISYKISKSGKIDISKVQERYIGYTVYKHNNYEFDIKSFYAKNVLFLSPKRKVVSSNKILDNVNLNTMLTLIRESLNFVYLEDTKPSFKDFHLEFKEISIEDILHLRDMGIHTINCFHMLPKGYFINHSVFITDNFENDREFSRHINRGFIYDSELNFKQELYFNGYTSIDSTSYVYGLSRCDNDNYRLAPDNYYKFVLIPD